MPKSNSEIKKLKQENKKMWDIMDENVSQYLAYVNAYVRIKINENKIDYLSKK